jgi:hypothetical protein
LTPALPWVSRNSLPLFFEVTGSYLTISDARTLSAQVWRLPRGPQDCFSS